MTIPFDVTLPHVNVLGSTMAYREAGDPRHQWRFSCTGIQPRLTYIEIFFRWLHRSRIASRLTLSGSANPESRILRIAFTITSDTSTPSLNKPASLQHS